MGEMWSPGSPYDMQYIKDSRTGPWGRRMVPVSDPAISLTSTFVRGIHRSPVNSPHKVQWRGALMFSFICNWMNGRGTYGEAGDLRRHHVHYDVTVMI